VTQGVDPEFKPQYCKKEKKNQKATTTKQSSPENDGVEGPDTCPERSSG
jgi:hypothetical protein